MSSLRVYYEALVAAQPFSGPPTRFARTAGNTSFRIPAIPGAKSFSFWMKSIAYAPGFLVDTREAAGGYWYYADYTQQMQSYVNGVGITLFGYGDVTTGDWVKVYVEPNEFGQAFYLLSRYTLSEFFGPAFISDLRIYGRKFTDAERSDPTTLAPFDNVLAHYEFTDFSAGKLLDSSGNAHHGQLFGPAPIPN
jgi:hypothetical protein